MESPTDPDDDDDARESEPRPYFIVLAEMILARVEYYLADLLSVLETGRVEEGPDQGFTRGEINLHAQDDPNQIPRTLRLPPNL